MYVQPHVTSYFDHVILLLNHVILSNLAVRSCGQELFELPWFVVLTATFSALFSCCRRRRQVVFFAYLCHIPAIVYPNMFNMCWYGAAAVSSCSLTFHGDDEFSNFRDLNSKSYALSVPGADRKFHHILQAPWARVTWCFAVLHNYFAIHSPNTVWREPDLSLNKMPWN